MGRSDRAPRRSNRGGALTGARPLVARTLTLAVALLGVCGAARAAAPRFELSFPVSAHAGPLTGRVFVFVSRSATPEPRLQAGTWWGAAPFFGADVNALQPGERALIDAATPGYPVASLAQLPAGNYYVQGLINVYTEFRRYDGHTVWAHMDHWEGQQLDRSPGNLYSAVQLVHLDPARGATIRLNLNQVIPPVRMPADTVWVKHIKIESSLLTRFWGHPIYLGATVLLPAGYAQHPRLYYPVLYDQTHFTLAAPFGFTTRPSGPSKAREKEVASILGVKSLAVLGVESGYQFYQSWSGKHFPRMIVVIFQHPTPYYDDSYAVNSVNNGPYGDAITQELIPYIETHFRIIRKSYARVLTGGSTGGWESLDLQVKYPKLFGGTWTFYPDPLDFHHFQMVNLYQDRNAFVAPVGDEWQHVERYMMRQPDGQPLVTERQMSRYEEVLGSHGRSGGQFDIFFATFGPIGADGYPVPLWNLRTGAIDRFAVAYARDHGYDITAYLRQNWRRIGPELVGKIHVYVGDMDTFYLNLGVYDLQAFMQTSANPHYTGEFVYGRPEKPHGWNGGKTNAQLIEKIAATIARHAPPGAPSGWRQ
jgi:Putative esterase